MCIEHWTLAMSTIEHEHSNNFFLFFEARNCIYKILVKFFVENLLFVYLNSMNCIVRDGFDSRRGA